MGRQTRVLMTADAVGGVWTYALDLARGLAESGVETTLAVLGPAPNGAQRDAARAIPGLDLVQTGLPLDWTARDEGEIALGSRGLVAISREVGCDLVHLNSPALAAGAAFPCPVVAVAHSCVATWWRAVRGGDLPADFAWRTELVRAGYEAADLLLAPTAAFARATADAYGLRRDPRVVRNGRRERTQAVAPTGESTAEPFVLTVGRLWDEGKNVAMLDRVSTRLAAPVLAAGPTAGPNGAAILLHSAKALGQSDPATLDRLNASRPVFASLALYEPFGLAVLEAAQAGCPLVLSDIPTFRELWDGAALFVDPRDEEGAASVLDRLLADPAERDRLGSAAQGRSQAYTLDSMVREVLAAYGDVLGSRARPNLMSAA